MTDTSAAHVPVEPACRPWVGPALEVAVSLATAALFVASSVLIKVYPIDRLGQISGLASLALRFFLFGLVFVVALVVSARVREGRHDALTTRLVCAGIAGLVSGMIAGGILVALRGTPWGLNAMGGDVGVLAERAAALARGEPLPPAYPPLSVRALTVYADVMGMTPGYAIKHLQILGVACFGPLAYLSWRLLLRPVWALAVGVITMLPLVEPYKPYTNLVLIAFVPLAILFLDILRDIARRTPRQITIASVGFGVAFGVMCLLYSGWFQWAAPGLFVATLIVFPWRSAWRKGALLLGVTGAAFLVLAGSYLAGVLFDPAAKILDNYVYFDVKTEPMYIAMWRGDTPGAVGVWPPHGELGGVGLFTIVLAIGLGLAIAFGRKTTVLISTVAMMAGAWLLRFFYARMLWDTKLVQLYPRTTPLILYCLLILCAYAVYWWFERKPADHPLRSSSGQLGAVCALLLVFGSAASSIADRYMPANTDPKGPSFFAYNAHVTNWASKQKTYKARPLPWVRRSIVPPSP